MVVEDDDEDDDDEQQEDARPPPRRTAAKSRATKAISDEDEDEDDEDNYQEEQRKPGKKGAAASTTPKKNGSSKKSREADTDEEDAPPKKRAKSSANEKPSGKAGSSKKAAIDLDDDDQDEKKAQPAPASASSSSKKPPQDPAVKASFQRSTEGPSAPGSKEIPKGKPNCLVGLTFVFTGQMESLGREEAQNLVKRYGAKVTGGPSSKTSFVVLGEGAGPSKLKAIEKNGLKTLDEDGLLNLIRERGEGAPDPAAMKKLEQEQAKIIKEARQMQTSGSGAGTGTKGPKVSDADAHSLWTVKYAPSQMKDLMGNNSQVEKLKAWLEAWPSSLKCNFKKPGKWGQNIFRAFLLSGPPGIGKTTAAHLVAKLCGYTPIELNASDTRSKRLIEDSLKNVVNNKSLDGWYNGSGDMKVEVISVSDRSVLILDEVDGMSGGDRGGIGAINALIKKSRIPIILIANDKKSQKMKPFLNTTFDLPFQRPRPDSIRARLMMIAYREGLKLDKPIIDQLIMSAQSDLRSVINMLATWRLSQKAMTFEESEKLGAANVKQGIGNPFTIYGDLAYAGTWSASAKKSLNAKADLYFQEPSLIPLFVQENYARHAPQRVANIKDPKQKDFETLKLMNEASKSISDGDVIDGMIHGPQQHWGLMPLHAITCAVKPMSLVHGLSNTQGSYGPSFPQWLGQNSKQSRLSRSTVELQVKMRLTASGSRWEVREAYAPYLFQMLSQPLVSDGAKGIPDVISTMDDYYLGLEDRDVVLELGVGTNNGDAQLRKIPKDAKAAFTRAYNQASHPIAFQRTDPSVAKSKAKQLRSDTVPDVEEAYLDDGADDGGISAEEMSDDDSDVDVGKDKMIKEKKAKAKGKAAAGKKK